MNIEAATLPDDTTLLKQMLVDIQENHNKQTGILLEEISLLRAQLYGRKSEKFKPIDGPQPLPLFDMPEPADVTDEPEEEKIVVPAHIRTKGGRKPLPDNLPRTERLHDIDDADKICGCGCELSRIGEEVSEQLDIIPAKVRVIRHIRPKCACKNCEGVQDEVLSAYFINIDETTLQVLKEPGRSPTTKSYMWVFRRGDPDRPVLLFQYHPTRSGDVVRTFLRDFQGYVQTDGYAAYNFLDHEKDIRHIGCWVHARGFKNVIKAQGKNRKSGAVDEAMKYIKKLYSLERHARKNNFSVEEIYQMRQTESKPVLDDFYKWLLKKSFQTPPKGLLGKAVSYKLNQWHRLIGYIEDGHLTPDNNMAENSIRHFVIGRNNWLFSRTPKGAEASALLYSLIETAKANKLGAYFYLLVLSGFKTADYTYWELEPM